MASSRYDCRCPCVVAIISPLAHAVVDSGLILIVSTPSRRCTAPLGLETSAECRSNHLILFQIQRRHTAMIRYNILSGRPQSLCPLDPWGRTYPSGELTYRIAIDTRGSPDLIRTSFASNTPATKLASCSSCMIPLISSSVIDATVSLNIGPWISSIRLGFSIWSTGSLDRNS